LYKAGVRVGEAMQNVYRKVVRFFGDLSSIPGWNQMSMTQKIITAFSQVLTALNNWLKGDQGQEVFRKIQETINSFFKTIFGPENAELIKQLATFGYTLGTELASAIFNGIKSNVGLMTILGAIVGFKIAGWKGAIVGAGGMFALSSLFGLEEFYKENPVVTQEQQKAQYEQYLSFVMSMGMTREEAERFIEGMKEQPKVKPEPLPAHARGGIFYTRHIAEVAERGAEAIIPLERTEQAVRLWRAVGEYIGAIPKEVTYSVQAQAVTPLGSVPYGTVTKSNVINLNVNTEGLISEVVINNKADVDEAVDKIVGVLAPELRKAFSNMVVG